MEKFNTIEYLEWNFQHFEKAKYLISQFAKKGRHDKHYRLRIGKLCGSVISTSLIDCVQMDGEDYRKGHMRGNASEKDFRSG